MEWSWSQNPIPYPPSWLSVTSKAFRGPKWFCELASASFEETLYGRRWTFSKRRERQGETSSRYNVFGGNRTGEKSQHRLRKILFFVSQSGASPRFSPLCIHGPQPLTSPSAFRIRVPSALASPSAFRIRVPLALASPSAFRIRVESAPNISFRPSQTCPVSPNISLHLSHTGPVNPKHLLPPFAYVSSQPLTSLSTFLLFWLCSPNSLYCAPSSPQVEAWEDRNWAGTNLMAEWPHSRETAGS